MASASLDAEQVSWIKHHHEWYDGRGYPDGLAGEDVPLGAQLLSLARERGTLSVALRAPSDSKVIENLADMPVSSLYDRSGREAVQHRPVTTLPSASQNTLPARVVRER